MAFDDSFSRSFYLIPEKRLAVFDVDGTLLDGDSLLISIRYSSRGLSPLLSCFCLLPWCLGFYLKLISADNFKEAVLRLFGLCRVVNSANESWLLAELINRLRPEALARLRWHQRKGDKVVLCSASPRMLLQPLADWLNVELICTELQESLGLWQPKLLGANCKGEEKVRRLRDHFGPFKNLVVEAYGNSKGDRALLKAASIPHYRSFIDQPVEYPLFSLTQLLPVVALVLFLYLSLGLWSQGPELITLLIRLWPQVCIGLFLVLLGYFIRYFRWRMLMQLLHQPLPIIRDARIWIGSYAFTVTPAKSGEVLRAVLLKKEFGVPILSSLMALLVERISDGFSVLLLLLFYLPLLRGREVSLFLPSTILIIAVFLLWLLLQQKDWIYRLFRWIELRLPSKFASAGSNSFEALRSLLQFRLLFFSTALGVISWFLEGVSLWLLLRGLGVTKISLGGAAIAHTSAGLLGALTLMPGGLGSTEAGTVGLLALQGLALDIATPATLLIRLMTLWFATCLGVICLLWHGRP
tara:strand:- start:251 stop:1825 length:1575 start_codon:yes stop_codon:yes gene_type:complete